MKLNKKLFILSMAFIVISVGVMYYILRLSTFNNYAVVQEKLNWDMMESTFAALWNELDDTEVLLVDWATWDATYEFIEGNNDSYIEENLPDSIYTGNDLEYVAIFDEAMNMVYGGMVDRETSDIVPLGEKASNLFIEMGAGVYIIACEDGYLQYFGTEITDSNGEAPYKGLMVFAYYIDDESESYLVEKIGKDIMIQFIEPDTYDLMDDRFMIDQYVTAEGVRLMMSIDGYGRLLEPIINSDKLMEIRMPLSRDVIELGRVHVNETMRWLILSLLVLSALMTLAVRFLIIKRIVKLNHQVGKITFSKEISNRVGVHGTDEIGVLSDGINRMLEELEKSHSNANWYANHDEMTGALNRRAGFKIIDKCIQTCDTNNKSLTVAFIDVDGLKKVNDTLGHVEGDMLIVDMTDLMKGAFGHKSDIVRLGGDEFIAIFMDAPEETVLGYINDLENNTAVFNDAGMRPYQLGFSYGLASYTTGMTSDTLVDEADNHMYVAKKKKKSAL